MPARRSPPRRGRPGRRSQAGAGLLPGQDRARQGEQAQPDGDVGDRGQRGQEQRDAEADVGAREERRRDAPQPALGRDGGQPREAAGQGEAAPGAEDDRGRYGEQQQRRDGGRERGAGVADEPQAAATGAVR